MLLVVESFKALGIRCADEVRLHIVDLASRIHEILLLLVFNLNHAANYAVNHVHGLTLLFLQRFLYTHGIRLTHMLFLPNIGI